MLERYLAAIPPEISVIEVIANLLQVDHVGESREFIYNWCRQWDNASADTGMQNREGL